MKKMTNKAVALGLVATMALSLTACNSASGNGETTASTTAAQTATTAAASSDTTTAAAETTAAPAEIVKPETIKVMWDGTIFKEGDNYAEAFYAALDEALGLHVEWVRPDHSTYAEQVGIAFTDKSTLADVVILPSNYYASYAAQGSLWNMTDAFLASDTYNSGRLIAAADGIIDGWYVKGPDGNKGIYGFYPARGNGCVTYVNAAIATKAGYTKETLPKTWAEYQDFLVALKNVTGSAPVLAAGLITNEAPYVNYLPEFYQDAYPDFYFDEAAGKWVDGFTTDAMAAALDRLAWGYANDVLDAQILESPSTADTRNKFYTGTSTSVFTYWAGTWAYTITTNLAKNEIEGDDEVWALAPIEEMGAYYERLSPMIAITSACQNPEGVFKYFIDTMLDGGEIQMLWQYGVKDVHYEVKEDGTIKGLPTEATATAEKKTATKKNLFEAQLKLAEFDTAVYPNGDPGYASSVSDEALESFKLFDVSSKTAPSINSSEVSQQYASTLQDEKTKLVAAVTKGDMTGAEAIAKYIEEVGAISDAILDSFNN